MGLNTGHGPGPYLFGGADGLDAELSKLLQETPLPKPKSAGLPKVVEDLSVEEKVTLQRRALPTEDPDEWLTPSGLW